MNNQRTIGDRYFTTPRWYNEDTSHSSSYVLKNYNDHLKLEGYSATRKALTRSILRTNNNRSGEEGDGGRLNTNSINGLKSMDYAYNHLLSVELSTARKNTIIKLDDVTRKPRDLLMEPDNYLLSPLSTITKRLLRPYKVGRKISTAATMILDAPGIVDDFYLNLLDWSPKGPLGVSLYNQIYLWDMERSKSIHLLDTEVSTNHWSSIGWDQRGDKLMLGENSGKMNIHDVNISKTVVSVNHSPGYRIGSVSWNNDIVSMGNRQNNILLYDVRNTEKPTHILYKHKQEVCGLKWDPTQTYLASGGNDNMLCIWDKRSLDKPLFNWTEHRAAVKALDWCPNKSNTLASGGGTLDKRLILWDINYGSILAQIDTGSQICNMKWSPSKTQGSDDNFELVTSHGYTQNQLILWRIFPLFPGIEFGCERPNSLSITNRNPRYDNMKRFVPLETFGGHVQRVIHLALDPQTSTVVTGSGDETLRFWNIFNTTKLTYK